MKGAGNLSDFSSVSLSFSFSLPAQLEPVASGLLLAPGVTDGHEGGGSLEGPPPRELNCCHTELHLSLKSSGVFILRQGLLKAPRHEST